IGGLGSAVTEFKNDNNYTTPVSKLGIPDKFIEQGSLEELHNICGYDVDGIVKAVKAIIK
ncbi:MAG: hypothetical protein B6D61_13630, partial [Bacteroidetes bacterium 4484_249]